MKRSRISVLILVCMPVCYGMNRAHRLNLYQYPSGMYSLLTLDELNRAYTSIEKLSDAQKLLGQNNNLAPYVADAYEPLARYVPKRISLLNGFIYRRFELTQLYLPEAQKLLKNKEKLILMTADDEFICKAVRNLLRCATTKKRQSSTSEREAL